MRAASGQASAVGRARDDAHAALRGSAAAGRGPGWRRTESARVGGGSVIETSSLGLSGDLAAAGIVPKVNRPAPYLALPDATLYHGDCRSVLASLPAESVHCVVTSPPYFGLRSYSGVEPTVWDDPGDCAHEWGAEQPSLKPGQVNQTKWAGVTAVADGNKVGRGAFCCHCPAWLGTLGNEPTPALYIQHIVEVFRAVRCVLRKEGMLWLNLGDSYAGSGKGPTGHNGIGNHDERQGFVGQSRKNKTDAPAGYKAKDLMMMPARVAIALCDDGWYLRSAIVWAKQVPMPESVEDRPTSSYEMIYLLAKSSKYYFDTLAVAEPSTSNGRIVKAYGAEANLRFSADDANDRRTATFDHDVAVGPTRNLRNVWLLGPEPLTGLDHYAAYPTEVPRRAILAGTSEHGVCAECGAPWTREVERTALKHNDHQAKMQRVRSNGVQTGGTASVTLGTGYSVQRWATGWCPSCKHDAPTVPATILDPFGGSGTTSVVSRELGRRSVYIDASAQYCAMAARRLEKQTPHFALAEALP